MRVLVTGSTGFAGTWLCRELAAAGHTVIGSGGSDALDLRDRIAVRELVARTRPEAVAHLAAVAHRHAAGVDPGRAMEVNVGGTINLLEAVRALPGATPVLVTGTAEVYGWPEDPGPALTEDTPLAPRGPYALSKAGQEATAVAYRHRHGLPVVVTRSFNHSGPGQRAPLVVPSFVERVAAVARGQAASIPVGDIDVRRDLLDVRDVVTAYRLLLERAALDAGDLPPVVNVASGRAVRLRDLLERLLLLAGVTAPIVPQADLLRPGEPRLLVGDPGRLQELTDWRPTRDPLAMVDEMWNATSQVPASR